MSNITTFLAELKMDELPQEVEKELTAGKDPKEILKECQNGMVIVGEKFANEEYYVSDLIMSGVLFKEVAALLEPYLQQDEVDFKGKVVLGTVENDVHDIGKDIVGNMLKASGFEVVDLGVDVPPDKFVDALKESDAKVLALSCLLASCYDSILATVDAIKESGLRDKVKIVIGGGPVDETIVDYSGADAYGANAQDAVDLCEGAIK